MHGASTSKRELAGAPPPQLDDAAEKVTMTASVKKAVGRLTKTKAASPDKGTNAGRASVSKLKTKAAVKRAGRRLG